MELSPIKGVILPLAALLLLAGCKDAEIQGTWGGANDDFNPLMVTALFFSAQKTLGDEHVSISSLSENAGQKTFKITLGSEDHSKAFVEQVLAEVQKYQASLNTQVKVKIINADEGNKDDRKLLAELKKSGIYKEGSETSQISWVNAEIQVYTQETPSYNLRSAFEREPIYCQIRAPLTKELTAPIVIESAPDITSADIPIAELNVMSEEQIAGYIKKENQRRKYFFKGLNMLDIEYPNKIIFSDKFMNELSPEVSSYHPPAKTYSLERDSITINYGEIKDSNINNNLMGYVDHGGFIHKQCKRMIKKITPELEKRMSEAQHYKNITALTINPTWSPPIPKTS